MTPSGKKNTRIKEENPQIKLNVLDLRPRMICLHVEIVKKTCFWIFGHNLLHAGPLLGYKCERLVEDVE